MPGVDYRLTSLHYNKGITIEKQYSRYDTKSNHLPIHMQTNHGRLACNQTTFNSYKLNNYRDRGFYDP
jgi:hypothetical protein